MTKRKFITILLLTVFALGFAGSADGQFWKRKKHKHKKERSQTTSGAKDESSNEEDSKNADSSQVHKSRSQRKKEKKELKRKEKKARKEREKQAKKEKKEQKKKNDKGGGKGKKGKGKKNGKGTTAAATNDQIPVIRKWQDIEYVPSQKKPRYRIDILAPMYLDELVKNGYAVKDIPEKAAPGINFYKGVQIAADTLKKAQFDIDIYVHDVASLLESTDMLVRKNALDSSDLIIGAVPSKDVPALAGYAQLKHINFISALSPSDGNVKDNQYFTMLQPSLKSHCEWIAGDIEKTNAKNKALLLYRTSIPSEENAYKYLTDDPANASLFEPLPCNTLPHKEQILPLIDTSKTNIVVVSVLDNVYADSLLRVLKKEFSNTHFEVYGMPTWSSMTSISKAGNFPNLTINITLPFSFDILTPQGLYVERVFKKEYGGKPTEMVYRGYETLFWYANLLMRHGTIFNKQYDDNEPAPFTKFEMKPQWDKAGKVLYLENRHLFVHKYDNGTYITR